MKTLAEFLQEVELLEKENKFTQAKNIAEEALRYAKANLDESLETEAEAHILLLATLAWIEINIGAYSSALEAADKAESLLRLYPSERNDFAARRVFTNKSLSLLKLDRYDEALLYINKAFDLVSMEYDTDTYLKLLMNRAVIYRRQKRFEEAITDYHRVQTLMREYPEHKSLEIECGAMLNIGVVYSLLEDYEMAMHFMQKSLDVAYRTPNKRLIHLVEGNLGILIDKYQQADASLKEAEQYLRTAYKGFDEMATHSLKENVLTALIDILTKTKSSDLAYFEQEYSTLKSLMAVQNTKIAQTSDKDAIIS